jgi:hypothetical protein
VRTRVLPNPSAEDADALWMSGRVKVFDVTLPISSKTSQQQLRPLCGALTIRKGAGTYLN